jgi:hypothetical protein
VYNLESLSDQFIYDASDVLYIKTIFHQNVKPMLHSVGKQLVVGLKESFQRLVICQQREVLPKQELVEMLDGFYNGQALQLCNRIPGFYILQHLTKEAQIIPVYKYKSVQRIPEAYASFPSVRMGGIE